jgi:hypothetical protein
VVEAASLRSVIHGLVLNRCRSIVSLSDTFFGMCYILDIVVVVATSLVSSAWMVCFFTKQELQLVESILSNRNFDKE